MFKLVLLYFELAAIFFDWDEVSLNEKINDHAITVATCLAANCWRVTEASSPSKTETGLVTTKRACRRFQNDQAESIFFSVLGFSAGWFY
jgi:hypothetical protein